MEPESIEDYYERIAAHVGADGRLPVAVEEMPGWDIFPYEVDSLRLKPLQPPAATEPARRGEDAAACWCANPVDPDSDSLMWWNERWKVDLGFEGSGLPIMAWLSPLVHCDLGTMPPAVAAELGSLVGTMAGAIEGLPSVGRAQLAKYGDGGAHLHLLLMGRPARMLQLRGSPLLDWEENLPRVPSEVLASNGRPVARALAEAHGGWIGPAAQR
ncbi:hypothetical protein [Demetria terragena]|uniref:hypothetical protein n=1 Tax=Demetria terragena TaxID=63959 RepID=UPI00036B147C|nr:hypothetical protein [Demetria terragena]